MKRIVIITLFCLSFTFYQQAHFSAGFSYKSGIGLNTEINYNLYFGDHNRNTPQLKISLLGEPKPGLLGPSGHARVALEVTHPDKKIEIPLNAILSDLNKNILNYNPVQIKETEKLITHYEALIKHQKQVIAEKKMLLQENDPEKKQAKSDKELFFERKKIFESFIQGMEQSENNPHIAEIKEMIADLEKSYEQ